MKPLEKIRTFFEIRLSGKTQKKIIDFIVDQDAVFKKEGWKVKWVHPDNVHLTLRFLGDIDESLVAVMGKQLAPLTQKNPFIITVKGVGAFPSFGSPRVIWIGVEDKEDRLPEIVGILGEKLVKIGFKQETKKFRPHITIGRVNRRGNKSLVDLIGRFEGELFGEDEVREFIFMKSELTREKAIHTPLFNVALKQRRSEPPGR